MNNLYQHLTVIRRLTSWAVGCPIFSAEDRANYISVVYVNLLRTEWQWARYSSE